MHDRIKGKFVKTFIIARTPLKWHYYELVVQEPNIHCIAHYEKYRNQYHYKMDLHSANCGGHESYVQCIYRVLMTVRVEHDLINGRNKKAATGIAIAIIIIIIGLVTGLFIKANLDKKSASNLDAEIGKLRKNQYSKFDEGQNQQGKNQMQ